MRFVPDEELSRLNAAIAGGGVQNRAGKPVTEPLESGLVPQSEPFVYPVLDGIPVLLTDEAIPMPKGSETPEESS